MSLKFGLLLPQGRSMELASIKDPVEAYEAMTRVAQTAEEMGFVSACATLFCPGVHCVNQNGVCTGWKMRQNSLLSISPSSCNECYNPTYGDEIAEAFNQQYKKWKWLELDADTIFGKLHAFTGGSERGSPTYEAAVLAVLAYLFEQCDIFERTVRGGW